MQNTNFNSMNCQAMVEQIWNYANQIAQIKNCSVEDVAHKLSKEALKKFLENPTEQNKPTHHKLAPEQVDENPSSCYNFFKSFVYDLQDLSHDRRQQILLNLQKYYPNISRMISNELVKEKVHKHLEKPSPFIHLVQKLSESVIGQDAAVNLMASSLTSTESGNRVFMFVGPSGVGKTELAKAVAKTKQSFVTFLMNQYQNDYDLSTFMGASTGYLGSDDLPYFAKALEVCKPSLISSSGLDKVYEVENAVILFDEFEKAHSKIKQSMLNIFSDFFCILRYTQPQIFSGNQNLSVRYQFKNCIMIATSNMYQDHILEAFKSNFSIHGIAEYFKKLNSEYPTKNSYSKELLSRMKVIPFGPIPSGKLYQKIIKRHLDNFLHNLRKKFREVSIENEDKVLSVLEKELYDDGCDIRKMSRYFLDITRLNHEHEHRWCSSSDVKIMFYSDSNTAYIKTFTFIDLMNCYSEVSEPISLKLS